MESMNTDALIIFCRYPEYGRVKTRIAVSLGHDLTLGIRILNAILDACNAGYERVVLIGSDAPDVPGKLINNAFHALRKHDAVLGPSKDEGYYLIGFRNGSCQAEYFSGIQWSSPSVFQHTVEKKNASGKTL